MLTFGHFIGLFLELIQNSIVNYVIPLQPQIRLPAPLLQEPSQRLVHVLRYLDRLPLALLEAVVAHLKRRLIHTLVTFRVHEPDLEQVCFRVYFDLERVQRLLSERRWELGRPDFGNWSVKENRADYRVQVQHLGEAFQVESFGQGHSCDQLLADVSCLHDSQLEELNSVL